MNKYEQLVEFIINDESDKARELFHQIVVEKSRDIYESLVAEEDLEETIGGNEVEDLVDEVTLDEEGLSEEEDDMDVMDMDSDEEGEEFDHHADVGGEEELEDRVMDLEDALDELKAEFDSLMAGEEAEEEQFPGIHGDDDMDMGSDELPEEMYEAEHDNDDEEEDEEVDESIVREYVEKVASPANSEGQAVGTGKSVAVNKKSTVAGKNDMGGSAVTSHGGNQDQNGNRPAATEKPKGTLVSNPQNKPGANAGKTAFKSKETAKTGEGQTTGQAVGGVNTKSPLRK
jgi:hypothetical protein